VFVCAKQTKVRMIRGQSTSWGGDRSTTVAAKFQTLCGRTFDSNVALAEFLGVDKSSVSHAVCDAKAKGRMYFECGKPIKRSIRILTQHVSDVATMSSNGKKNDAVARDDQELEILENRAQNIDAMAFLRQSMKAMQVHAHLQAAALKLFPDHKLFLLEADEKISNTKIATVHKDDRIYFDVAETWMLHAYARGEKSNFYSFVQKVEAVDVGAYASCLIGVYHTSRSNLQLLSNSAENILGHRRAFMSAEDMINFFKHNTTLLESDFAATLTPSPREIHMEEDKLSEDKFGEDKLGEDKLGETKKRKTTTCKQSCAPPTYLESIKSEYSLPTAHLKTPATTPEDEFMKICGDIMKNVDDALQQRTCLLAQDNVETESVKKRKCHLAADSIRNVTTILFAANRLLYSTSQQP
jgi:hypothetical protein